MEAVREVIKNKCIDSLLFFTRFIFKENTGNRFEVAPFHIEMASTLKKVNKG